jgi:predicted O-methyltransferase YrrM
MHPDRAAAAQAATGFMPHDEGMALYEAARSVGEGPMFEIGAYCGKSTIYLGTAAEELGSVIFSLDHHRGSEENQAGWEHHDVALVDGELDKLDTLPTFRRTIHDAGLEGTVVAVVGDSPTVGAHWTTPLGFLFIDGGHGEGPAHRDFELWTPHVRVGGVLAIHDVFPDPADGGRPPYEIYRRAIESEDFADISTTGSLRVLRRTKSVEAGVGDGVGDEFGEEVVVDEEAGGRAGAAERVGGEHD